MNMNAPEIETEEYDYVCAKRTTLRADRYAANILKLKGSGVYVKVTDLLDAPNSILPALLASLDIADEAHREQRARRTNKKAS